MCPPRVAGRGSGACGLNHAMLGFWRAMERADGRTEVQVLQEWQVGRQAMIRVGTS